MKMTTAEEGIEPELVDNGLSEDEDGDDDWDENDGSVRRCDTKNNGHEGEDELYKAMKFVLIVGATVGLTPLVAAPEGHGPSHPFFRGRTLLSILCIVLVGSNAVFMSYDFVKHMLEKKHRNMGDIAGKLSGVWFYACGLFVHVFCLIRSYKTSKYFRLWGRTSREISSTIVEYTKLRLDLNCMCAIVIVSCLGENTLFHVYSMRTGILMKITDRRITFWDFLEDYYCSNQYLFKFFDYNPILSMLVFISNKLTLLAVNFGDVVLMILFWLVHIRFKGLNQFLQDRLTTNAPAKIKTGSVSWSRLRRNYFRLIKLLDGADAIFYPLIWVSYATNIFFVCNQLYLGIRNTEVKTSAHKVYVIWSFFHLALRTLAVNLFAAKIHEDSEELGYILQFCPSCEYNDDVRRLERFLSSRVVGITANGIFVVTRSFIIMIISAIVTLEVVLLQNSSSSPH